MFAGKMAKEYSNPGMSFPNVGNFVCLLNL